MFSTRRKMESKSSEPAGDVEPERGEPGPPVRDGAEPEAEAGAGERVLPDPSAEPPEPEDLPLGADPLEPVPPGLDLGATTRRRRSLKAWVGEGAKRVVSHLYESRADDLEQRARRVVGSAYRDQADDLEERATRALRYAIRSEADKIKEAIEHGVAVKKREVRLSLLVLVVASLIYLALFWFTQGGGASS